MTMYCSFIGKSYSSVLSLTSTNPSFWLRYASMPSGSFSMKSSSYFVNSFSSVSGKETLPPDSRLSHSSIFCIQHSTKLSLTSLLSF